MRPAGEPSLLAPLQARVLAASRAVDPPLSPRLGSHRTQDGTPHDPYRNPPLPPASWVGGVQLQLLQDITTRQACTSTFSPPAGWMVASRVGVDGGSYLVVEGYV